MADLKTSIDKEHFLTLPNNERDYVIFSAVQGHEDRITKLENQKWFKGSLAFVGGIIGGVAAKFGLG